MENPVEGITKDPKKLILIVGGGLAAGLIWRFMSKKSGGSGSGVAETDDEYYDLALPTQGNLGVSDRRDILNPPTTVEEEGDYTVTPLSNPASMGIPDYIAPPTKLPTTSERWYWRFEGTGNRVLSSLGWQGPYGTEGAAISAGNAALQHAITLSTGPVIGTIETKQG